MDDALKQKQINKQIQSGVAEVDRLKGLAETLETDLVKSKSDTEKEISRLNENLKSKRDEVSNIDGLIANKVTEIENVENELSEVKGMVAVAKTELVSVKATKDSMTLELEEATVILKKTRATITKEKEEASADYRREENAISGVINSKKEELVVTERSISKAKFIKNTADEALAVISERNSELEKKEKDLRNKSMSHESDIKNLINERVGIVTSIKEAKTEFESDKARQIKAKQGRVEAEEALEVAETKLLSTIERWDVKEGQLNARAEKLKQAYEKAGIEWPNL